MSPPLTCFDFALERIVLDWLAVVLAVFLQLLELLGCPSRKLAGQFVVDLLK